MADRADTASGRLRPEACARGFADLHPPLDDHHAVVEASRCHFCYDAPCIEACPTGIDIPSFIRKIATGNLQGSATDILSANVMGGTCARVCPTEVRPGGQADRAPRGGGDRPRLRGSRLANLGHRWHRDLARRRGAHRVGLRLGAGLHGCHARRSRDRRGHDRRPRLDGPRGLRHARRLPRPGDADFRRMAGSRSRRSGRKG